MGEALAAVALRVALVVGTYGAGQGSGGQAELLVQGLRARGHHVVVFSRSGSADGVLPRSRGALFDWARHLPQDAFDVVFAFERLVGADIVRAGGGVHAAWLDAAPDGWRRWRLAPKDRRELRLDREAARGAGAVVCNAERVAAEVIAHHGVPRARVMVVRNGVDLARFRPSESVRRRVRAARGVSGRVALFLGHDGPRKGLDVAIDAFQHVRAPGDALWVAGRHVGPLPAGVVSLGVIDPAEVLPAVDAMLLPTRYDPSANATLEALACGVPPVTSGRDGASEVIDDRRLRVASPLDVQGFAEALRYAWAVHDPERWRAVAEGWPASRMVGATERLLEAAAERRRANG